MWRINGTRTPFRVRSRIGRTVEPYALVFSHGLVTELAELPGGRTVQQVAFAPTIPALYRAGLEVLRILRRRKTISSALHTKT
jgi:hypothetical protein